MTRLSTARAFFEACDYGKGWKDCQAYCHKDASFETDSETLDGVDSRRRCDRYTPLAISTQVGPVPASFHPGNQWSACFRVAVRDFRYRTLVLYWPRHVRGVRGLTVLLARVV